MDRIWLAGRRLPAHAVRQQSGYLHHLLHVCEFHNPRSVSGGYFAWVQVDKLSCYHYGNIVSK